MLTGDNFTDANLAAGEVELLALLLRKLTYQEWEATKRAERNEVQEERGLTEG